MPPSPDKLQQMLCHLAPGTMTRRYLELEAIPRAFSRISMRTIAWVDKMPRMVDCTMLNIQMSFQLLVTTPQIGMHNRSCCNVAGDHIQQCCRIASFNNR